MLLVNLTNELVFHQYLAKILLVLLNQPQQLLLQSMILLESLLQHISLMVCASLEHLFIQLSMKSHLLLQLFHGLDQNAILPHNMVELYIIRGKVELRSLHYTEIFIQFKFYSFTNDQNKSLYLGHSIMNGFGHIAHIFGIEANHRNPAVFEHVNMMSIDEMKGLSFSQACIRKHAYLVSDVMPASGCFKLFEFRPQAFTHGNHSFSNPLQLIFPFFKIGLVVKDLISNSGTSKWWRGVLGSNDHLQLAQYPRTSLFVGGNNMKGANSFSIKSHILGIRLSNQHIEPSIGKQSDGCYIVLKISTGKSLVGCIKERNEFLLFHHVSNLKPIVFSRIDSSWIVSAGMQQDNISLLGIIQEFEQVFYLYSFGDWVIVRIVTIVQP